MTLLKVLRHGQKLATDNSPAILTAIGVVGVVTTAILSGKATLKATDIIDEEEHERELREVTFPLEPREKVKLVWHVYIPPVGSAVATITCIICANRIGTSRAVAMAAAYSLSEKAFEEYRTKITERFSDKREQAVRDEIAQDRINRNPASDAAVIITTAEGVLCYDSLSGRYFKCTMEALRRAENDINFQIIHDSFASLTDFYELVGLTKTAHSEEVGWNVDRMLALEISTCLSEDGRPCLSVEYHAVPIREYFRLS